MERRYQSEHRTAVKPNRFAKECEGSLWIVELIYFMANGISGVIEELFVRLCESSGLFGEIKFELKVGLLSIIDNVFVFVSDKPTSK